jgi:hypothetical protein
MVSSTLLHEEIAAGQGEYLGRAMRRFPAYRQGKAPTLSCGIRWIVDGVVGPNGERIRLEATRLAGRWLTTPGAITRFLVAQTPQLDGEPTPTLRTPSARARAADRAAKELDRIGI